MYQVYAPFCLVFLRGLKLTSRHRLQKREKLPLYNTVDDAVELIEKSRNIVILTGAGISEFAFPVPPMYMA